MARRSYRQFCGLARALDVVGERWTLLIARQLLLGPRRYTDLLAELPGLTTNLLAKRLHELEDAGLVTREELDRPAPATVYALTPAGAALEPALMELARWGGRYLTKPRRDDRLDAGWGLLSMKRRYKGGVTLVAGVDVDGRWYSLSLEPTYLRVTDARPERPDVTVRATFMGLRALLFADEPDVSALRASGAATIDGDPAAVAAFLGAFLPPRYAHLPRPSAPDPA